LSEWTPGECEGSGDGGEEDERYEGVEAHSRDILVKFREGNWRGVRCCFVGAVNVGVGGRRGEGGST